MLLDLGGNVRVSLHVNSGSEAPIDNRPNRSLLYFFLSVGFAAFVMLAALLSDADNPRVLYLCGLFMLCCSPIIYSSAINGPYSVMLGFLPFYFFAYGGADLVSLIPDSGIISATTTRDILSAGELAVLCGALLFIAGYRTAVRMFSRKRDAEIRDWAASTAVIFGLAMWAAGYFATWIMQTQWDQQKALGVSFSTLGATAMVIGRMIEPLGLTLLAYQFVSSRSRLVLMILVSAICAEFVLGFIGDSKELALRGALIVIMAKYLIDGSAPKKWLVITGVIVAVTFGVFQAYRLEVLQLRHQTRTAAAADIKENLDTALGSNVLSKGLLKSGLNGFVGRTSLKPTMELITNRVGKDVRYQYGYTIGLFFNGFIPRIIWPNKPDSSVGQLFNRQFRISQDPDTYISATHLGELYWNFGWPGVVVGMFLIGMLLGTVGVRFAMSGQKSVTSLLVLITTIYLVCLRFEGGIALQYTLWIRSLGMIYILHLCFARSTASVLSRKTDEAPSRPAPREPQAIVPAVMTGAQMLARMQSRN